MSKYCGNCGSEMPDSALVCGECGTPLGNNPNMNSGKSTNKGGSFFESDTFKKLLIPIGAAVVVLIVAIIVISSIISSHSPEGIAKKAIDAFLSETSTDINDYRVFTVEDSIKAAAEEREMDVDEYLEEYYNVESIKEYYEEQNEDHYDDLEDTYGEFDYEIRKIKVDDFSSKELKELKSNTLESTFEYYSDVCDYDVDDVKAACTVEAKVKIDGDDDNDTFKIEITMIKIKGSWKIFDFNY